jgi:hypothetical protein
MTGVTPGVRPLLSLFLPLMVVLCPGCPRRPAQTNGDAAGSGVIFAETQADLGSVYAELAPWRRSFSFANRGDRRIEVEAKACCGSRITFKDDRRVYEPGERGEVIFEVMGVARSYSGPFRRTVALVERGNGTVIATLVVTGNVRRKWHIVPVRLDFGKVKPGQTLTTKVTIESGTDDEQLEIVGPSPSLPSFLEVAQTTKRNRGGRTGYEYTVALTGDGNTREWRDKIAFRTTSATVPEITVPVRCEMVGPVVAKPPSLYFGRVAPGTRAAGKLLVLSSWHHVLQIQRVSSIPDLVRLQGVTAMEEGGGELALCFECPVDATRVVRGQLSVVVNTGKDPNEPVAIEVPWVAVVGSS